MEMCLKGLILSQFLGLSINLKYLPLFFGGGISMEFEVVTNATDAVVTADGTNFSAASTSNRWTISDVVVECDTITLDSALQNSYIQHVMS
jgi:hypothetical protein